MTFSRQALARLAAIGLLGGLLQLVAISQIAVLGVPADVAPLLAAFVGLLAGSIAGAVFGFAVGVLIDVALMQTLGVSSLVLTGVGYAAGRLREQRDPAHGLVPLAVGAAATAAYAVAGSLMLFLLGLEGVISLLLLRQVVLLILLNTLIALPLYALIRRVFEPCLPEDPRRRRRRAYTTGGLSPITRP